MHTLSAPQDESMTKSARFQIELLSAKLEASELRHTLARRNAVT